MPKDPFEHRRLPDWQQRIPDEEDRLDRLVDRAVLALALLAGVGLLAMALA